MTPLPPDNGHLSTLATFFCPQGGSLRTADVFLRLLFASYPGGRCGRERFHVVVLSFFSGFLAFEHAWRPCSFRTTCTTSCKVVQMGFSFYVFIFYLFIWLKKSYYSAWKCIFLFGKCIRITRFIFEMTFELMKLVLLQKRKKCTLMRPAPWKFLPGRMNGRAWQFF